MDTEMLVTIYNRFMKARDTKEDKHIEDGVVELLKAGYNGDSASLEGLAEFGEMLTSAVIRVTTAS